MKKAGFALLWIAVTTLLGVATWTAVGLAGEQVSDGAISPLSASQIASLPVATSSTTVPVEPTTGSATSTTTSTTVIGQTTSTTMLAATTTTAPASTSSTTTATTTTVATPAPGVTSVHSAVGGTVAVEVTGEAVRMLWAKPSAGFLYEVEEAGPDRVEVEFRSSDHESHLRAEVVDGELRVEIEEEPDGS